MDRKKLDATLTVDEAHEIIGRDKISRASMYNAIGRKQIPHVTVGRRILIPRFAFLAWLNGEKPEAGRA